MVAIGVAVAFCAGCSESKSQSSDPTSESSGANGNGDAMARSGETSGASSGGAGTPTSSNDGATPDEAGESSGFDSEASDSSTFDAAEAGPILNSSPFGNLTLHPDRIGFYMVPDLENPYVTNWGAVGATLAKLHALMPDAWIRWDNETGHNTNNTTQVTKFVDAAQTAGVPLIVAASACPGYNNMWANQYVTNNPQAIASSSITDIANGGFLDFTNGLMTSHSVVKFIETLNEPDGPGWFVTDPDNASDFDSYASKLYTSMGITAGNKTSAARLLGPAVAFSGTGNIWNDWMNRSEVSTVSYHTYGDPPRSGLKNFPGKDVYVTEYGPNSVPISPASLLEDLLSAERQGLLSSTIKKVFYNQILQNGGNPSAFSQEVESGQPHFAMRGWFRALAAWAALGAISNSAQSDVTGADHVSTDDRRGHFGMLLWNNAGSTKTGQTFTVANTSTRTGTALNVFLARFEGNSDGTASGDSPTGECHPLSQQSAISATPGAATVSVTVNSLSSEDAALVTTESCADLAD